MIQENVWQEFITLPLEAQQQVADFIAFLRTRYGWAKGDEKISADANLAAEPFVGMWRDRADMHSSVAWVRNLREKEWEQRT